MNAIELLEQRREAAIDTIREGEYELECVMEELLELRRYGPPPVTVVEGGYYRTRKGQVRGPMRPLPPSGYSSDYAWTDSADGEGVYGNVWTAEGFYMIDDPAPDDMDLIAEDSPLT
jgi:hypothetical protein